MKKSKKIVCVTTFIAVCVTCFTLKSQSYISSIDTLMMQNVMALSANENGKYFVITWTEEVGREETATYIKVKKVTHTTCPTGGKQQCTSGSYSWDYTISKP